jgi:manganese oxidase
MRVPTCSLLTIVCLATTLHAQSPTPIIRANDNRVAAGTLKDGVLSVHLDVVRGFWHPDRDSDPGVEVLAFAEPGKQPSIPGPLLRVPAGTTVRAVVRNTLADSSILIVGLSGSRGIKDSVRIKPGEVRELEVSFINPGNYWYRAVTSYKTRPLDPRYGEDGMLGGAVVVDEPGKVSKDRVLVLFQWVDSLRLKGTGATVDELLTINGRSWPSTERMNYQLGETITWRVINASFDVHPMHLHGAYYDVVARGAQNTDTIYSSEKFRRVVTERLLPFETMTMRWTPERAGNWLFHCHLTFHMLPHAPLADIKASTNLNESHEHMGGLVLGTTVHGALKPDNKPRRNIRLAIQQFDSVAGDGFPRYSFRLDTKREFSIPGADIVVAQDEPIAITVVNNAKDATSIHWHGLEIESYYDGVHGFGGDSHRVSPLIEAGDSFVVKMTPPRAGTFIYHTHADEARQQGGGLYGAFIVLPKNRKWDAAHERPIVLATGNDTIGGNGVDINGRKDAVLNFKVGETYRLRMINITLARPSITVEVTNAGKLVKWNMIAQDGADLPAHQAGLRDAKLQITIGQTFDALFSPKEPGDYVFEVRTGAGVSLRKASFRVTP